MTEEKNYNQTYYEKNKERILLQIKEKIKCDCCGCYVNKGNFHKHKKTTKHMLYSKIAVPT